MVSIYTCREMEFYREIEPKGPQVSKILLVLLIELGFFLGGVTIINFYAPFWVTYGNLDSRGTFLSLVHTYYCDMDYKYCEFKNAFSSAEFCKSGFSDCTNSISILYTGNQVMLIFGYTSACLLFLGSILLIVAYCKRGIYLRFVQFLYLLPGAFYSLGMIVFFSAFGESRKYMNAAEYNFELRSSSIFSIFLVISMFAYGAVIILSMNKLFTGKVNLK